MFYSPIYLLYSANCRWRFVVVTELSLASKLAITRLFTRIKIRVKKQNNKIAYIAILQTNRKVQSSLSNPGWATCVLVETKNITYFLEHRRLENHLAVSRSPPLIECAGGGWGGRLVEGFFTSLPYRSASLVWPDPWVWPWSSES